MDDAAEQLAREARWIRRVVLQDDQEAFAELVRLHQSAVRQFLRRLTGNDWSRADDLAQETFWRAYRYIGGYQGRGRFLSWLFRIAYQRFVTDQRGAERNRWVELPEEVAVAADESHRLLAARTFDQLLTGLRADERAAIVLHYRHELTHVEVAETMELPLGTVKSLLRRARLKLQASYQGVEP